MRSGLRRRATRLASIVAAHAAALLALELAARGALAVRDAVRPPPPPLAESRHTRYDPDVGWSNVPGARIADMYGPGRHLTIGPQGFRGAGDARAPLPPGVRRMVCSGDSFTFGYGVDDADGFCAVIAAHEGGRVVANLAQGGYGLDQAYLRYRRDGLPLEHDLHILGFITEDLVRMEGDDFLGHGKPVLFLEDGRIRVRNVPVPRDASAAPAGRRALRALESLAVVKILRALHRRLRASVLEPPPRLPPPETTAVAVALLEELARLDAERDVRFVAVHLPVREEHDDLRRDAWRAELAARLRAGGVEFVDLVPALRRVPAAEVDGLFISPGEIPYAGAEGHYTAKGNAFVASALAEVTSPR